MQDTTLPKILIVDDEPLNIDLLRETLKSKYRLIVATKGEQAVTLATSKQPDLILMDIMMPVMDGYETCEKIKDNPETSHIPVIFVSALNEVEDKGIGYDMGGNDYITKPFEMSDVLACIETHLKLTRLTKRIKELETESSKKTISDNLVKKIADLNTSINGNTQIIKLFWSSLEPIIKNHASLDIPKNINDKISNLGEIVSQIINDTREMALLIDSFQGKRKPEK
ncbi:response regulator receiver sensor signal transduction histidine kinase [Candidatus Magnetomorum sp. HK-1]|nr:response regulator receiver sensor signal transduction histidine kinase [Candidatus Magnetomorum sp. HK-1]